MSLLDKLVAKAMALLVHRRVFRQFGRGSFMIRPIQILNPRYISIGRNVRIRNHLRLEAIDKLRQPDLVIGDHCNIEQDVHIICSSRVHIGSHCSITARCAIVDTSHPFRHIGVHAKIGDQLNPEPASVVIGDGCFLGIGVVIQPDVRLGRRCVVGANAVVLAGDYPDGSVLAGVPARVVGRVAPEDF
jgi:acetyltransferase-like isoleucine patch superfamily enzyme